MSNGTSETAKKCMQEFVNRIEEGGDFSAYDVVDYCQMKHSQINVSVQSVASWCRYKGYQKIGNAKWRKTYDL